MDYLNLANQAQALLQACLLYSLYFYSVRAVLEDALVAEPTFTTTGVITTTDHIEGDIKNGNSQRYNEDC